MNIDRQYRNNFDFDNKLLEVQSSNSNSSIVKIIDLVTDYVSDTNSINISPSYFHPVLEDCIPDTIKNQIYDIELKAKNYSGNKVSISNNFVGDWIVQSESGIIQFFDQSASFYDLSNNF